MALKFTITMCTFKLLGVIISSDLSWDSHVTYILHKVAKQMYCINYLVRSGVPTGDILCVYCSIIRSVLEYACAVWYPGLTKKLSQDTDRVQKRCLKLLYPALSYNQTLNKSGLDRSDYRRDVITLTRNSSGDEIANLNFGVPENRTSPHITAHHRTSQIYGHNCTAHHLDRTAHHSV